MKSMAVWKDSRKNFCSLLCGHCRPSKRYIL